MNSINLLTETIDSLWLWTYGIIAGWGLTVTVIIVMLVVLMIRTVNLQRRVYALENRLINAEREFSLNHNTWPGKK